MSPLLTKEGGAFMVPSNVGRPINLCLECEASDRIAQTRFTTERTKNMNPISLDSGSSGDRPPTSPSRNSDEIGIDAAVDLSDSETVSIISAIGWEDITPSVSLSGDGALVFTRPAPGGELICRARTGYRFMPIMVRLPSGERGRVLIVCRISR